MDPVGGDAEGFFEGEVVGAFFVAVFAGGAFDEVLEFFLFAGEGEAVGEAEGDFLLLLAVADAFEEVGVGGEAGVVFAALGGFVDEAGA